jgi:hypothetical protein
MVMPYFPPQFFIENVPAYRKIESTVRAHPLFT